MPASFTFRRRAPRHWLLVRPADDGQAWQWRRLPGHEQGAWPPPADYLHGDRHALVIPAALCSHFHLAAPPGLKRHEWPLLLEEQLQQPLDQVQVHALSRQGQYLELLVVDRACLQGWRAEAQALGLDLEAAWAEAQLLGVVQPGEQLGWRQGEQCCLVRCDAQGRRQWLVWPDALGALPDGWYSADDLYSGAWPQPCTVPPLSASCLGVQRQRRPMQLPISPLQRRLVTVAAVLGLCWASLALVQWVGQVPAWKRQVEVLTGPVSNVQQARRSLARLQAEQTDWRIRQQQLVSLEQQVGQWLQAHPDWGVSASQFDGRTWRLVLNGDQAPPAEQHWQTLADAGGAAASAERSENGALLTVRFDLGGQP